MMRKSALQEVMAQRTPLGAREAVHPADLYTNPQVENTTSLQDRQTSSPLVVKQAKPQMDKYTTHLRPETIKAIKRMAVDQDKKDYEIVQAALDAYLAARAGETEPPSMSH